MKIRSALIKAKFCPTEQVQSLISEYKFSFKFKNIFIYSSSENLVVNHNVPES